MNSLSREELGILLTEAGVKRRLKQELRFVPEEITDWQDRDFLAVTNRGRSEGVLIAPLERTRVAPFRLQKRSANAKGRVEAIICDICATWQRGSNSAIITFQKESSTVSFLCCEDLLCSLHVRDKTSAAKLSRTQLREQVTPEKRIQRLKDRLRVILATVDNHPDSNYLTYNVYYVIIIYMIHSRTLTPELARTQPDAFKEEIVHHMGTTTELGALAWNMGMNNGTVDLSRFELNPHSWVSQSNGAGRLILGTQPMSDAEKSSLLFHGEQLSYPDEVSRRLLHELGHGAFFLAQRDPYMRTAYRLANNVRTETDGALGFSALGSHPFYRTPKDKSLEDVTELLTMRMVSGNHFDDYMALLNSPRYEAVRSTGGVVELEDTDYLADIVERALVEALDKNS